MNICCNLLLLTVDIHCRVTALNTDPGGQSLTAIVRLCRHVIYLLVHRAVDTGLSPSGNPRQLGKRSGHGLQLGSPLGHKFWSYSP